METYCKVVGEVPHQGFADVEVYVEDDEVPTIKEGGFRRIHINVWHRSAGRFFSITCENRDEVVYLRDRLQHIVYALTTRL